MAAISSAPSARGYIVGKREGTGGKSVAEEKTELREEKGNNGGKAILYRKTLPLMLSKDTR